MTLRLRRYKGERRAFTPMEDCQLLTLRIAGFSLAACAEALDRGRSSVQVRLDWLAERDETVADAGEPS